MAGQTTLPASLPISMDTARTVAAGGSALGVLGALIVFAWSFLNWDDSPREVITGPGELLGCAVATVGATLLILALPRVLAGLAPWAVAATVASMAFVLADAWYSGTVGRALASEIDDATYDTIYASGWVLLFYLPKMLLGASGFIGLAISGRRTDRISLPLCILLAVAGLAALAPPFMPGMVVGGIALFLVTRSIRPE